MVERASAGTYTCHASSKEGTITHTTRVLVQGRSGASRRALAASRGLCLGPQAPHCPPCPPPLLQGRPSSWCRRRTSPLTSLRMPFWRARPRRTRGTSPTPGSRAAATSSTSGTAGTWCRGWHRGGRGLLVAVGGAGTSPNPQRLRWGTVRAGELCPSRVPAATLTPTLSSPRSHLQARVRILVDGSLLLQRAIPDDAGKYTCVASNGLWKPPSASAFVTVLCKSPGVPPVASAGSPVPSQHPMCVPPRLQIRRR